MTQFGATVVLARLLAPSDYGSFAMVLTVTGFASLIVDLGFSNAAIQATHLSNQQRTNLFWISLSVGLVSAAAATLVTPLVTSFYGDPSLNALLPVTAISLLIQGATAQFSAEASRQLQFTLLAVGDISSQAFGAVTGITAALLGAGVWSLVIQQISIAVAVLLIVGSRVRWLPGLPHRAPMKSLLTFGFNSFAVQLFNYASSNADSIVLGRTAGATALGIYNRGYQLFRLPVQQILTPLTRVALPMLARVQGDAARFNSAIQRLQLAALYTSGGVFFLAAALAQPLIQVFLGPGWTQSAQIFAILAIGGLFQVMGYIYYWTFLALALTGLQLKYTIISRTAMVGLIILGTAGGPNGVAIAVSVGLAVNWIILTLGPMRRTGVDMGSLVKSAIRPFACHAIVAALAALLLNTACASWPAGLQLLLLLPMALIGYALAGLIPPVRRDYRALATIAKGVR